MRLPTGRTPRDIHGSECRPEHVAVLLADGDYLRTQLETRLVIPQEAAHPSCIDHDEGTAEWAAREADLLPAPQSLALPVRGVLELSSQGADRGERDLADSDRVVGEWPEWRHRLIGGTDREARDAALQMFPSQLEVTLVEVLKARARLDLRFEPGEGFLPEHVGKPIDQPAGGGKVPTRQPVGPDGDDGRQNLG